MNKKKLYIKTYGCQMNIYDSLKIEELLYPLGFSHCNEISESDVIILNTCHIREKAAEKTYSELGRIKKTHNNNLRKKLSKRIIVVTGCVAQAEGEEIFNRAPYVDIVIGPQSYHNLPNLIEQVEKKEDTHILSLDFIDKAKFDNLPIKSYNSTSPTSSFLSIQEGCDKFCTFCVVPYTRGSEFSRNVENIYREALNLVYQGSKEIYLLGQNVNAYHGISSLNEEFTLSRLIKHLSKIKDLQRIRYTTSHPKDMSDDLIQAHAEEKKLMPFLHLPVQSGSDKILKKMNRRHSKKDYLKIIEKLKVKCPNIALSSDFIVGFPEETDQDFRETLDLVKEVGYANSYSFKYSPRIGTPAQTREQIADKLKSERLAILQELLSKQRLKFNNDCLNKNMEVLFEKKGKFENQLVGRTEYLQSVYIESKENLIGKIRKVKITETFDNALRGKLA